MSRMRQKRKARGEAERATAEAAAAAEALAEQAGDGLEITEESDGEPSVEEPVEGDEVAAEAEADGEPDPDAAPLTVEPGQMKSLIEALLFASDKPLSIARLKQLSKTKDGAAIQAVVDELQTEFSERGIVLQEVSGGYLFRTHNAFSQWVQQLVQGRPVRLSRAQLETLALVAYRQPITRPEIDQIRGVDSGGTLKVLLDRSLVRILGKKEEPGRPILYGTTREFLDFFSLKDLRELPTLREYSELSEESKLVVERMAEEAESESGEAEAEA
jgi:segregation and condensation protein B